MDCNTGAVLGRQFAESAMAMHSGAVFSPTGNPEQDALMGDAVMSPQPPGLANEWAQHFAAHHHHHSHHAHHHHVAMQREQHQQREMEEAFRAVSVTGPAMLPPHMAGPMMPRVGLGGFMAAPPPVMPCGPQAMAHTMLNANTMAPTNAMAPVNTMAPATTVETASMPAGSGWAEELRSAEWAQNYDDAQVFHTEGEPAQSVEQKSRESEFYLFMDKIHNRELLIDPETGRVVSGPGPDPNVAEDTEYLRDWAAAEGLGMPPEVFEPHIGAQQGTAHTEPSDEARMEDINGEEDVNEWTREFESMMKEQDDLLNKTDYPFEPNNPYMYHDQPMEEGRSMLELGNLAEAALAFEAVCQKEPKSIEPWRMLGKTQAENEKDSLAIIALNNARELNPKDIAVHAALAVSHTNEHNVQPALKSLRAWLLSHPQYEHLGSVSLQDPGDEPIDITREEYYPAAPSEYGECSTLFNAALEMNPTDPDLHANLGVLYNLSQNFDMAVVSLRRAVELSPNSADLWNKLGATLANNNCPQEALVAYNRAIDINPGYVRVMYNMAIAYSNMLEHRLAAKQITRAIAVQEGRTQPQGEGSRNATRSMWDLLRMALNIMNRTDLVELTWKQEIGPFLKEFGLEELML